MWWNYMLYIGELVPSYCSIAELELDTHIMLIMENLSKNAYCNDNSKDIIVRDNRSYSTSQGD